MSERRTHWLRKNAAQRMPRRVICIDSEAYRNPHEFGESHTFRLASLTFDKLDVDCNETHETVRMDFGADAALWAWAETFTASSHRTVCFMHNAAYDVRLTNALTHLPALGWRYTGGALNSYGYWSTWRKRNNSLALVDSLSFLPAGLDRIAQLLQREKLPLPDEAADEAYWLARCRTDVEVTREAILRVIRYLKGNDLGDFRNTGAGQASAAFRHRFLPARSLLVHDDAEALDAERRAAHAGRAEVWRHGVTTETLYEYDYEFAYARIGQAASLPARYQGSHGPIPQPRLERVMNEYCVLAECVVETDVPIVPVSVGGHTLWPVGRFTTALWDSELRALQGAGSRATVTRYYYYRRSPILRGWADWIITQLNQDTGELDPVIRLMLKDWSRSLIGRFGLRYASLEQVATLPIADLALRGVTHSEDGSVGSYLQIGNQLFDRTDKIESPNSTPAIMSYVMAQARLNLWEATLAAGQENVYYLDTDGIITNRAGAHRLDGLVRSGSLSGLRRKAAYAGGDFRSPRNVDLGELRRVSGAPRSAERLGPNRYQGQTWESLQAALQHGKAGTVRLREQTFEVSDFDPRRLHLPGGATAPIEVGIVDGENVILSDLTADAAVA